MKMSRQKVLIALVVIFVAYAILTYLPSLLKIGGSKPALKKAAVPLSQPVAAASAEAAPGKAAKNELETPPAVDPFARRINVWTRAEIEEQAAEAARRPAGPNPEDPKLEGIWVDSGRRVAFISNQTVNVGGQVLGWTVTSIERDRVVVEKNFRVKILKMEGK